MSKQVEFLYDFGSPTTYLASRALPKIAEAQGAEIIYTPILLGAVFKATGNNSPAFVPAKGAWMFKDLARWAKKWDVPMQFNPNFPINTLPLMRGAVAFADDSRAAAYREAVFNAIWVDGKNMGDPEVIAEVVTAAGIPAEEFLEKTGDQAVKDGLKDNTEKAIARGVFGAPTFFIGEEMFFGQDRLDFVAEELS